MALRMALPGKPGSGTLTPLVKISFKIVEGSVRAMSIDESLQRRSGLLDLSGIKGIVLRGRSG
jgi:hypothetical protein